MFAGSIPNFLLKSILKSIIFTILLGEIHHFGLRKSPFRRDGDRRSCGLQWGTTRRTRPSGSRGMAVGALNDGWTWLNRTMMHWWWLVMVDDDDDDVDGGEHDDFMTETW